MNMTTKLLFEDAAQQALVLIKQGTSLDVACEATCTSVVNARALMSYIETHYASIL